MKSSILVSTIKMITRPNPWTIFFCLYIVLALASMVFFGVSIYPDRLVGLLIIPVLLMGQAKPFIRDWIPFLGLLFSYEYLRGIIGEFDGRVHYFAAARVDVALWGTLPTIWLQSHLFHPGNLQWYDFILTFAYLLHFVAPVILALILWLTDRSRFTRFTSSFLLLSYAGLTTYLLFPAAPPWLASQQGFIPHVSKILDDTLKLFPDRFHLPIPTVYQHFDPNLVAAIPSLHAAYPTLILLYAVRFFRWRGFIFAPYAASVWLMVIYFGEHYFIDVLLGIVYATTAFVTIEFLLPRLTPTIKYWVSQRNWPFSQDPATVEP